MNAHTAIPVIATGKVFDTYLCAARANLANLVRLADGLRDAEFAAEARNILQVFEETAEEAFSMIESANSVGECA